MKQHKKILSIFLAALLLLQPMTLPANASVSENNTQAPPEEPSISANDGSQETNLPGNDLDADVAKPVSLLPSPFTTAITRLF